MCTVYTAKTTLQILLLLAPEANAEIPASTQNKQLHPSSSDGFNMICPAQPAAL
jgi:hypothetical protein